jgi:acetolactate synthase regulatory subunit
MNAASDKSERLQRVLEVLRRRGAHGATSRDLIQLAHTVAPNSCVAELRQLGYKIECARKGRTWTYRLLLN